MADLQGRVRERLRADLLRHGASPAFNDPELFAEVERVLHAGVDVAGSPALLLPELLGDPATWRLETALRYDSHRGSAAAGVIIFVKQRLRAPGRPLAVRVQPRQLRAPAPRERGAVRLRAGAGHRDRQAASRRRAPPVKLACVVQRYGADIAGGSEAHCRAVAERLARHHSVTVLTSCARDYVTWANAYPPGDSLDNGVRVRRFAVRQTRKLGPFSDLSDEVFDGAAPPERQRSWFAANGPDVPGPARAPPHAGSRLRPGAVLDFPLQPQLFRPAARRRPRRAGADGGRRPRARSRRAPGILPRAGRLHLPHARGSGAGRSARRPRRWSRRRSSEWGSTRRPLHRTRAILASLAIAEPYVLYLGRVDRNKGCHTLLDYFQIRSTRLGLQAPGSRLRPQDRRHAGARRPGQDSDSRASAHSRAGLRVRRGAAMRCCAAPRRWWCRRRTRA